MKKKYMSPSLSEVQITFETSALDMLNGSPDPKYKGPGSGNADTRQFLLEEEDDMDLWEK